MTQTLPQVAAQVRTPPRSQVVSLYTYISLFSTTLESPVLHLFIVPTSFCFPLVLFLFSTTYLLLLMILPRVSESLASSGVVSGILCPDNAYGPRQGSSPVCPHLPGPARIRTSGHLSLALHQGPVVLGGHLTQAPVAL